MTGEKVAQLSSEAQEGIALLLKQHERTIEKQRATIATLTALNTGLQNELDRARALLTPGRET